MLFRSSALDYFRLHDITMQAWSPLQYGYFGGSILDSPKYVKLNDKLEEIADRYDVDKSTIAFAWILRHPAGIQPITGTMNLMHLADCAAAADITLTRREWYSLYCAAGNILP